MFSSVETAQTGVMPYLSSSDAAQRCVVLNMEKPASSDLLEHFVVRAVTVSGAKPRYGFTRTGLTGFDVVAVPLVQETLKSIYGAATQYQW